MEELRRALGGVFLRDVRAVEPGKKGVIVSENVRIYDEDGAWRVAFLRGTDAATRSQLASKLEGAGVAFEVGPDFEG